MVPTKKTDRFIADRMSSFLGTFCVDCEACKLLERNGCDCDKAIFQLIARLWTSAFEDCQAEEGEIEYSKRKLDSLVEVFAHWERMEIESSGTVTLVKSNPNLSNILERFSAIAVQWNAIVGCPLPNFFVRNEVETANFNELREKLKDVRLERRRCRTTMLAKQIAQKNSMENHGHLVGAEWHKSASGILEMITKKCHKKLHMPGCSASAHLPRLE